MIDHAPAIAAFPVDTHAAAERDFDLRAIVDTHWPSASNEEIERGLHIAAVCIDARLAEIRAEDAHRSSTRIAMAVRANMVVGVAAALGAVGHIEELPAALEQIDARWPDLPWSVFVEGARVARGPRSHETSDGRQ